MYLPYTDRFPEAVAVAAQSVAATLTAGAGYGRLALRATQAFPELARYVCTDAVPEATPGLGREAARRLRG